MDGDAVKTVAGFVGGRLDSVTRSGVCLEFFCEKLGARVVNQRKRVIC